jgi:hypothetical protein
VDIQAEQEKKNLFTVYPLTKAFSERGISSTKNIWQTWRNSDGKYMAPIFQPSFQYEQINCLPPSDLGAWRTPTHQTPLHYKKPQMYKCFVECKQQEDRFCYLYLYKAGYWYEAFKVYWRNPPLKTLNLEKKYLSTKFNDLQIMINWESCQIHITPDRSTTPQYGFIWIHPATLLEPGWHELYTMGSEEREKIKIDEQDYTQMSPDELENQVKMICDTQEKQRKDTFERAEEKKKQGTRNTLTEDKLINQFKLFAKGMKVENRKYDWLEKPKPFNGKMENYKVFKSSVMWYLYSQEDI